MLIFGCQAWGSREISCSVLLLKKETRLKKNKSLDPWNTRRVCLISLALRGSEGRGGRAVSIKHRSTRLENVSGFHGATWGGLWEASSPAAAPPCSITCEQKPPAPASWVICWKKLSGWPLLDHHLWSSSSSSWMIRTVVQAPLSLKETATPDAQGF